MLKALGDFGVNTGAVLLLVGIGMVVLVLSVIDIDMPGVIEYAVKSAPIWLPVITFHLFFEAWMEYVQLGYDLNQGRVTLEIKLPQEILKSPEAMELVLIQLHQTASPDNHLQTYLDGKHPPVHSLELVSRGGDVRFYINTPRKKFKNMFETQLYAQYPGIEVTEVPIDYTAEIPWDPKKYFYFSLHFGLKKADAYPIKTYIEYGLNTMPKEEEKVDPITSMLETLGSIGPGEFFWVQVLIDANRKTNFKVGSLHASPDWTAEAREVINKIIEDAKKRSDVESNNVMQLLTETEKDTIKAIERSMGKNAFNVAIRGMYLAKADSANPGERIGALITGWRGYDDLNRNAIGIGWRTDFDWNMWQDPTGKRALMYKKKELAQYKKRRYTQRGSGDSKKVMTTEELATIFHLPGKVATTPSLARIPSRRVEAPPNLPTGQF